MWVTFTEQAVLVIEIVSHQFFVSHLSCAPAVLWSACGAFTVHTNNPLKSWRITYFSALLSTQLWSFITHEKGHNYVITPCCQLRDTYLPWVHPRQPTGSQTTMKGCRLITAILQGIHQNRWCYKREINACMNNVWAGYKYWVWVTQEKLSFIKSCMFALMCQLFKHEAQWGNPSWAQQVNPPLDHRHAALFW